MQIRHENNLPDARCNVGLSGWDRFPSSPAGKGGQADLTSCMLWQISRDTSTRNLQEGSWRYSDHAGYSNWAVAGKRAACATPGRLERTVLLLYLWIYIQISALTGVITVCRSARMHQAGNAVTNTGVGSSKALDDEAILEVSHFGDAMKHEPGSVRHQCPSAEKQNLLHPSSSVCC